MPGRYKNPTEFNQLGFLCFRIMAFVIPVNTYRNYQNKARVGNARQTSTVNTEIRQPVRDQPAHLLTERKNVSPFTLFSSLAHFSHK